MRYLERKRKHIFENSSKYSIKRLKYRKIPHNIFSGMFRYSIPQNYRIKVFQVPHYRIMWPPCTYRHYQFFHVKLLIGMESGSGSAFKFHLGPDPNEKYNITYTITLKVNVFATCTGCISWCSGTWRFNG